ncbi:MAG: DUF1192 domain-containing protein [Acidithiobacillus sp.]|nr:DUF1192 domain-containing protein [Acidithiobacillus sp.]
MKLQRYDFRATDVALGECEDGDFVRYEDCAALEAEIERLRAEIERLKAPPKVLSANEVTEPGGYWFRVLGDHQWILAQVFFDEEGTLCFSDGEDFMRRIPSGQFIGPLTPPEV